VLTMIKLTQSIPYFTSQEREAFSHDQTVFNALQLLRSYGFKISYEGVLAPDCSNDEQFEAKYPGMGAKSALDELNRSS
jgi:hypothetical protein